MTIPENAWFKSSYSGNDDNCVEVAFVLSAGEVGVRDTKDRRGGQFAVQAAAWRAALDLLRQA